MKRGNNYDTARIAVNYGSAILMDCVKYSTTTARHKLHTWRAAVEAGLAIIEVPNIFPDCDAKRERNLSYLRNNVMFWRGKLERARTDRNRAYYRAQLERAEDDAEAYKVNFLSKEGTR